LLNLLIWRSCWMISFVDYLEYLIFLYFEIFTIWNSCKCMITLLIVVWMLSTFMTIAIRKICFWLSADITFIANPQIFIAKARPKLFVAWSNYLELLGSFFIWNLAAIKMFTLLNCKHINHNSPNSIYSVCSQQ